MDEKLKNRILQAALDKITLPMRKWRQGIGDAADSIEETNQQIATYLDLHPHSLHHDRKLPSEDELALWLCDHLDYTSRELAHELLRLLGGKP